MGEGIVVAAQDGQPVVYVRRHGLVTDEELLEFSPEIRRTTNLD